MFTQKYMQTITTNWSYSENMLFDFQPYLQALLFAFGVKGGMQTHSSVPVSHCEFAILLQALLPWTEHLQSVLSLLHSAKKNWCRFPELNNVFKTEYLNKTT